MSTSNDDNDNEKINNGIEFVEEEEDRLSSLPNCLILTILNLLPINSAVATSVLSRRWRHLWTDITHLSFVGLRNTDQFRRADRILSCLTSPAIHTFEVGISFPPKDAKHFLFPWVSQICALNPEVIKVHLGCLNRSTSFRLPTCLLQTRSLVSLGLTANICFKVPDEQAFVIDLPNLKKLHLILPLSNLSLIETLFKSCPLLEDLTLCFPLKGEGQSVDISAPNLKCLNLFGISSRNWKVVIDTPKLEHFNLGGNLASYHFVHSPSTLEHARIDLQNFTYKNDSDHLSKIQELFQGISCVRSLRLDYVCCHLLSFLDGMELPNLVQLSLGSNDWDQIPRLSTFLLAKLKNIKISSLLGTDHETKLLKYILNDATGLEELHVAIIKSLGKKDQLCSEYNFCKELFMLPRSSISCQIKFSGLRITTSSNDMRNGALTCQIVD